jgi:purine-nucleoside phosphorylase|tara:strand:- start:388 stop:1212 length:825 start_codon:yes stop_codon:yes gene_type:complete
MIEKINEAKEFISALINNQEIETMIILGSGMGGFEENYEPIYQIDYSDIPNFLTPSIEGHAGKLSIVTINEKLTAILSGRAHYYEGYPIQDLVIPVRTFSLLGVKNLILTNAAGGISEDYEPGDIVSITDHINLTGNNPLIGKNLDMFGPRFPDMSEVYDKKFQNLAKEVAKNHFDYKTGIYAWFTGPSYETPAEVQFAKNIGADLVGMSTVPEAIVAKHAGMKISAFSLVTNLAAGISKNPLNHEEVVEIADQSKQKLQGFMKEYLIELNSDN